MARTRRGVLAGAGATLGALAGCLAPSPPAHCDSAAPPPAGFRVENRDDGPHTVEITVVRDLLVHVETVFTGEYELAAGERTEVADVVDTVGRHVLTARLDSGATGRLYWSVTPGRCNPALVVLRPGDVEVTSPAGVDTGPPGGGGG